MSIKNKSKEKGFSLIELLVSIALFAIVIVIILGAIMTIVDSNRKARSLMTVMNNLNFSVDSMVRSFKTGQNATYTASYDCFTTEEIDYASTFTTGADSFRTRQVTYCFDDSENKLTKTSGGSTEDLTSPDITINSAEFRIINQGSAQPLLKINLQGTVTVSPTIESSFEIQTSVSQRKLEVS